MALRPLWQCRHQPACQQPRHLRRRFCNTSKYHSHNHSSGLCRCLCRGARQRPQQLLLPRRRHQLRLLPRVLPSPCRTGHAAAATEAPAQPQLLALRTPPRLGFGCTCRRLLPLQAPVGLLVVRRRQHPHNQRRACMRMCRHRCVPAPPHQAPHRQRRHRQQAQQRRHRLKWQLQLLQCHRRYAGWLPPQLPLQRPVHTLFRSQPAAATMTSTL